MRSGCQRRWPPESATANPPRTSRTANTELRSILGTRSLRMSSQPPPTMSSAAGPVSAAGGASTRAAPATATPIRTYGATVIVATPMALSAPAHHVVPITTPTRPAVTLTRLMATLRTTIKMYSSDRHLSEEADTSRVRTPPGRVLRAVIRPFTCLPKPPTWPPEDFVNLCGPCPRRPGRSPRWPLTVNNPMPPAGLPPGWSEGWVRRWWVIREAGIPSRRRRRRTSPGTPASASPVLRQDSTHPAHQVLAPCPLHARIRGASREPPTMTDRISLTAPWRGPCLRRVTIRSFARRYSDLVWHLIRSESHT
jgi:hypothetical protein